MNILQKLLLFLTIIGGTTLATGSIVSAQSPSSPVFGGAKGAACRGANLDGADPNCKSDDASKTVQSRIQAIINILSIIVGIVAVILIIINGLKFVTSNGDSNSISSARSGVIYAIVGLIVAALAQVIVRFVLARI